MNVFVLCTGRCGSMTFSEACKHIKNYTSSHESKNHLFGKERLNYPNNHIEVDNRLSWFLGSMDKKYGNDAYYVHLKRDTLNVAKSYLERWEFGITKSYHNGIILGIDNNSDYNKLSFPYKWDSPDDILHHNLDHDVFKKWTNNKKPYRVRYINDPISRKRVIYMIKF